LLDVIKICKWAIFQDADNYKSMGEHSPPKVKTFSLRITQINTHESHISFSFGRSTFVINSISLDKSDKTLFKNQTVILEY